MLGLGLVLIGALQPRAGRLRRLAGARPGPRGAMLTLGVSGGLLFALAGNWTWMAVVSARAARLVDPASRPAGATVLLCAALVLAGGVTAALRSGAFRPQRPGRAACLRHFAGGAVMGASAALVPGGNATLLVHGLPSLAPHALAAYAAMTAALCVSFLATGRERARSVSR